MSKPIDILVEEHDVILRMLQVLEKAVSRLERGENVPAEVFLKAADFIKTFADHCHHAKEEDILFKVMERRGIPVEGGPIGVMLYEHDEGRKYRKGLEEGARALERGEEEARHQIAENARGYIALLSQHIHKENNILYPMGERVFSPEDIGELEREFDRVEKEISGKELHEKYRKMVEELEKQFS
jgi:hemerythrin-like domain-containing protein